MDQESKEEEPASKKQTVGEAMQNAAKGGNNGKGGKGKGKGKDKLLDLLMKELELVENRLRELEGILLDQLHGPCSMPGVEEAKGAISKYMSAKDKQGLGAPQLHVAVAFLEARLAAVKADAPPELKRIAVALRAVMEMLTGQGVEEAACWIKVFRVADMFKKPGKQPQTRVVINLAGHVGVPGDEVVKEYEALKSEGKEAEVSLLCKKVVEADCTGVPEAGPGLRRMEVQRAMVFLLCSTGCTRLPGKPPRGKIAYKLRRLVTGVGEEEEEGE